MAEQPQDLAHTVLYDRHVALGGRMVGFGGYALPVQYEGIVAEHNWTRQHAGLFDVSHMGPSFVRLDSPSGDAEADHAAVAEIMESLTSADVVGLKPGQIRYTLLLNDEGGIRDDLMVARPADDPGVLYVVVNAGTKEADFEHIEIAAAGKGRLVRADSGGLLALQGPKAAAVLEALIPGVGELGFMQFAAFGWQGADLLISRSGYTGEDGFEILVPADTAGAFWDALLADDRVKPAGLGARDSLRLEAGLPLYGHDLDETVSPIEADLGFAVSKARRERADFPGAGRILREREDGPERKRVGLFVSGAPAREGAEILADEAPIGIVTSGGFSPSLGRAIAMGYVPPAYALPGTRLKVLVRGRQQDAEVTELPFVPHNYYRKPR